MQEQRLCCLRGCAELHLLPPLSALQLLTMLPARPAPIDVPARLATVGLEVRRDTLLHRAAAIVVDGYKSSADVQGQHL